MSSNEKQTQTETLPPTGRETEPLETSPLRRKPCASSSAARRPPPTSQPIRRPWRDYNGVRYAAGTGKAPRTPHRPAANRLLGGQRPHPPRPDALLMARSLAARKRLAALGEAHMNLMVNPECPDAQRQAKRFARPPMTETALVKAARDYLNAKKIPNVRVHSGGAPGAKGGWISFANNGAPDIIAILPPAGRTLCLGVESGAKQTDRAPRGVAQTRAGGGRGGPRRVGN